MELRAQFSEAGSHRVVEGLTGLEPILHVRSSQCALPRHLVFICLVPSFLGMQRRGTVLSWRISTPRRSRKGTRILIKGETQGWGGLPHLCFASHKPINRSLYWGHLISAFGPRRQLVMLANYCWIERLHIKCSVSKVIIFGSCSLAFNSGESTLGFVSQMVYLGRQSRKETSQSQASQETLLTLKKKSGLMFGWLCLKIFPGSSHSQYTSLGSSLFSWEESWSLLGLSDFQKKKKVKLFPA